MIVLKPTTHKGHGQSYSASVYGTEGYWFEPSGVYWLLGNNRRRVGKKGKWTTSSRCLRCYARSDGSAANKPEANFNDRSGRDIRLHDWAYSADRPSWRVMVGSPIAISTSI